MRRAVLGAQPRDLADQRAVPRRADVVAVLGRVADQRMVGRVGDPPVGRVQVGARAATVEDLVTEQRVELGASRRRDRGAEGRRAQVVHQDRVGDVLGVKAPGSLRPIERLPGHEHERRRGRRHQRQRGVESKTAGQARIVRAAME